MSFRGSSRPTSVFFLIPRLAGQNSYQLATEYAGSNPTRATVIAIETKLGLNQPINVQYGRFLRTCRRSSG